MLPLHHSRENINGFIIMVFFGEGAKQRLVLLQYIPICFDRTCFSCSCKIVSKRNFFPSVFTEKNKFAEERIKGATPGVKAPIAVGSLYVVLSLDFVS